MKVSLSNIEINNEIKKAVLSVLDSKKFILGEHTQKFEENFAKLSGVKYAACVNSGTAALFLTLKSLGIKKNDEVILPSLSYIATSTPVSMLDAKPKFVDVNEKNYTIDVDSIEEKITKKTKGIIPVHLYGHPANMDKIKKIAKENSLFVLEDAAQAHGAKYNNKPIGSLGNAACFSFYPSKNLTVCGDGGIVVSNDLDLIKKIKILRDHGRTEKYVHNVLGYNLRFNEIQAAIGNIMLKKLLSSNASRRKIAKYYDQELNSKVITPYIEKWATPVYHMYTIRTKRRDELQKFLKNRGISTGIHYPIPIHKQPVYKEFNKIKMPITEEITDTTLSIPMYPNLPNNQQKYVIKNINDFFENR
jgi:perosamine synthetase